MRTLERPSQAVLSDISESAPFRRTPADAIAFGPDRPRVRGKFFDIGGTKYTVRGVTYGTFRPGPDGSGFPGEGRVERDFGMMAEVGFNTVRVYTPPPERLLDQAEAHRLRVLVGLPWEQHIAFLHENGRARSIEERVRADVRSCAGHPALFGFAVGNEIPASIVRWSGKGNIERHLERLCDATREADPETIVTYVNFPSTEYLELPFLDFSAFNVYLESPDRLEAYLARLQNVAGERPLVMAELGLDSIRHGADEQAFSVAGQIRTAFEAGCAGAFVFSWTDEWHRGGHDVTDWAFGLTTAERRPKPALSAVSRALNEAPFSPDGTWPSTTVVVCAYNAAATIKDCLDGLMELDYPDFDVIVVDDGSEDATSAIAARYPIKLIRQPNQGLSRARNTGMLAASGEIIAYIDADARPDAHWLKHLATTFAASDFAGVGGPNIAPAGDGETAACIAASPGGPIHILLSDREAEHIPGCNMAFRRDALMAVGGFDARFRVAGDDVDICWRLLEDGNRLGFSPAAVVWHHQRDTVRAFWKQQRGYGEAEALLETKWPEKYNTVGHVTWGGNVYGRPLPAPFAWVQRVYHGTWGSAPFQSLQPARPGVLASLAATPEWYLVILLLGSLSLLGIAWNVLLLALPLLAAALVAKMAGAIAAAGRARFPDPPDGRLQTLRMHAVTALLHLVQPAARLFGRLRMGLVPWRIRSGNRFRWPRSRVLDAWSEQWRDTGDWLRTIEANLRARQAVVLRGSPHDRWDLEVRGGHAGFVRVSTCVEEHGQNRQLLRFRLLTRTSASGFVLVTLFMSLCVWAVSDFAFAAAVMLAGAGAVIAARAVHECGVATSAVLDAIDALAGQPGVTVVGTRNGRDG